MNLVLTGGLVALGYLFSRPLMGLFIVDSTVLELAQELLHITLWSMVLFGMATVFSGAMRAGGTVWMPLLISIVAITADRGAGRDRAQPHHRHRGRLDRLSGHLLQPCSCCRWPITGWSGASARSNA